MLKGHRIALAASGTKAGRTAEKAALEYCRENNISELLVIHIYEKTLARYGEIDQLASGSCKSDFMAYIKEKAIVKSRSLLRRINEKATKYRISIEWFFYEGDPLYEISSMVQKEKVSVLFIGAGEKPKSFFYPQKNTAFQLTKRCACKVLTVHPKN